MDLIKEILDSIVEDMKDDLFEPKKENDENEN